MAETASQPGSGGELTDTSSLGAASSSKAAEGDPPRASPRPTRISRSLLRSLVAVLVGSLILRLAAQTMGQMLQSYFDEIHHHHHLLPYSARGFIIATFFIAELIGSIVLGAMSDRYGRKRFIMLGPLFGAVAVQITSMTVAIPLLILTRLLEGLSTASAIPATLGYISDVTKGHPNLRARVMGLFEITLVGGIAMGAVAGGYLWKYFGKPVTAGSLHLISPAFCLNGLIYLLSLAVFVWGLRPMRRSIDESQAPLHVAPSASAHPTLSHYRQIMKSPAIWSFVPAWLAIFSIIGMWGNHAVGLLTGSDHYRNQVLMGAFGTATFGNGFAILAAVFAAGVLGWSLLMGRYRKTSVMLIATGGLALTLIAVSGINHLSAFSGPIYYPLLALLGVGVLLLSGFTPAALTYLADVTEGFTQDRGSIMGLYSVFLGVGQLVGITTGGFFADWNGVNGLIVLSAIFGVITLLSLVALHRREPSVAAQRILQTASGA